MGPFNWGCFTSTSKRFAWNFLEGEGREKEYSGTCTFLILKIPSELQNHRPKFQF